MPAVPREGAHAPRRTHLHALARTQTHARTHGWGPSRSKHTTRRQRGVARARPDPNGAHMQLGTRAVPPRVRANVGGRDGGGVTTAKRSHERTHARMHLRYRTQSGDAMTRRYPQQQPGPNCLSHLAIYPPITTQRACIRKYPSIDQYILRTHTRLRRCVRAGGVRESECEGGMQGTLEHPPGRTAVRSSPEQRRAAAWLQHVSARPSRVGTRRWCGADSCHGRHAHPHALLYPQ